MITRHLLPTLLQRLEESPAVLLLGPRQVGKTTLALQVASQRQALYLDLEAEADRARLAEPALYLGGHLDKLVILDELHRAPGLFPILRGLIDRARRESRGVGRYLLLGSASLDLLQQTGESLAGRVSHLELSPLTAAEAAPRPLEQVWLRGGFPESLLAAGEGQSLRWRQDFIRTYLERDIPQFGPRLAAETLRRFWTMLAHQQGGLLNAAALARGLGIHVRTVTGYLDLLVDLLLARRLAPWHANVGKRLVKSPKVYVRDSGLVHALLGLGDREALLGHPVAGTSWEGFVIENLLAAAPAAVQPFHYRTGGGAEIDLLLAWPDGRLWAVEVKRSLSARPTRGFHAALADLAPARAFVVHAGEDSFPLGEGIEALPLAALADLLRQEGQ
jgi:predicted AAA+ superfamily ATPase